MAILNDIKIDDRRHIPEDPKGQIRIKGRRNKEIGGDYMPIIDNPRSDPYKSYPIKPIGDKIKKTNPYKTPGYIGGPYIPPDDKYSPTQPKERPPIVINPFTDITNEGLLPSVNWGVQNSDNIGSISSGGGNKSFRQNSKDGLWMGASTFAEAPFSVDMSGNVIASSGTFGQYLTKAGSSQTLSGDILIGGANVKIDGANGRILINDGTNNRIVIGNV